MQALHHLQIELLALDVTDDTAVQVAFDTNVFSVLRVNRAVLPHVAARKQGMFITIGSVVAQQYARPLSSH